MHQIIPDWLEWLLTYTPVIMKITVCIAIISFAYWVWK